MTTPKDTRTKAQIKRDGSAFMAYVSTLLGGATLLVPTIVAGRFLLEGALPSEWPLGVAASVMGLGLLIWGSTERRAAKRATP